MPPRSVAVFGSSDPKEGDPLYELARATGELLARAGFLVITGGYGGVMEGACRGAREAGGSTLGVVASAVFSSRAPNVFLSRVVETPSLHERTRILIESSDAYLILDGKTGTLAEAALVWALMRARSLEARPVLLLGPSWRRVMQVLVDEGMLDGVELRMTRVADDPDEAIRILDEFWR